MADHQNLIDIGGERLGDAIRELGHPQLELGRVGAAPAGGIAIIVHQVVGVELGVLGLEPAQNENDRAGPEAEAQGQSGPAGTAGKAGGPGCEGADNVLCRENLAA